MSIVKWTVSIFNSPPSRQEYSHETAKFYMHARGRGRDAKDSTWTRYFDTEAEALEFIRQRAENKANQKRVDHINRCGVELLDALEGLIKCFDDGVGQDWNAKELDSARAAIAKAKGPA